MRPKSIVITGASSGIGASLTKALASDGHDLFVCARGEKGLAEVTSGLQRASFATCDVGVESDVRLFFERVGERLGSVDVLIHCAAVIGPIGVVTDVDAQKWLDAVTTDLFGAFLVTKYAVPLMRSENRPRILLLSGGGAFDPMPNLSAYGVSKAGIVRLAESLAIELAPRNIAVNVFAPGFVATGIFDTMLKAGRERGGKLYDTVMSLLDGWDDSDINLPIECARFLISDSAAPLTGKTISARFDPWDEPEFVACLAEVARSRLYGTQRVNVEHIENEAFVEQLQVALKRRKARLPHTTPAGNK